MKKFEYKTIFFRITLRKGFENNDATLNQLGSEGWECVNAYPYTVSGSIAGTVCMFKREIGE